MTRARVLRVVVEPPDGVRVVFTSPHPFLPGTVRAVRNGMWQRLDYLVELSQTQVQVEDPPPAGDSLELSFAPI